MTSTSSPSFFKRAAQHFKPPSRSAAPRIGENDSDVDPNKLKTSIIKVLESQSKRVPADLNLLIQAIALKSRGGYDDDSKQFVLFLSAKVH